MFIKLGCIQAVASTEVDVYIRYCAYSGQLVAFEFRKFVQTVTIGY